MHHRGRVIGLGGESSQSKANILVGREALEAFNEALWQPTCLSHRHRRNLSENHEPMNALKDEREVILAELATLKQDLPSPRKVSQKQVA